MIVATYLMGAHVYKSKSLASGAQISGSGIFHPRKEEKRGDRLLAPRLFASLPSHLLNESCVRAGWGYEIAVKWRSPDRSVLHHLLMTNTSQGGRVHRQLVTKWAPSCLLMQFDSINLSTNSLAMPANLFMVVRASLTLFPGLRIRAQGGRHHHRSFEYHHAQHQSHERQHLRIWLQIETKPWCFF